MIISPNDKSFTTVRVCQCIPLTLSAPHRPLRCESRNQILRRVASDLDAFFIATSNSPQQHDRSSDSRPSSNIVGVGQEQLDPKRNPRHGRGSISAHEQGRFTTTEMATGGERTDVMVKVPEIVVDCGSDHVHLPESVDPKRYILPQRGHLFLSHSRRHRSNLCAPEDPPSLPYCIIHFRLWRLARGLSRWCQIDAVGSSGRFVHDARLSPISGFARVELIP